MRGYLEALRDGVVSPSKETFELLHEETLRLVRLVEDLLQLARADASKGTLSLRMIDLQMLGATQSPPSPCDPLAYADPRRRFRWAAADQPG
jgi:signal transduction histidine kinase